MSIIFRAALRSGCGKAPSSLVKLGEFSLLRSCGTSVGNCCSRKTLACLSLPLPRDYSVKTNVKTKEKPPPPQSQDDTDDEGDDFDEEEQQQPKSHFTKDGNEVIYTGFLSTNIRLLKIFSLSTSLIGMGIQPYVYARAVAHQDISNYTLPLFGVIAMFAIATPLLLNLITKRYVLTVEYNQDKDKYYAEVYNLFAMKKKIEFTPGDVTVPTVLGMFTTCAIKGKPMFLDAKSFTDQYHYVRIMGYDKPVDIKLGLSEDGESSKKNDN